MVTNFTVVPSLRDLLHIIFKKKTHILLFLFCTVFVVGAGTFMVKPKYEAKSQILVKVGRENVYMPEMPTSGNMSAVVRFDREEQINSEIEILLSPTLAENVVKSLGPVRIYSDLNSIGERVSPTEIAVNRLQKNLRVEGISKSNLIEVRFKHTDPQVAAKVVNEMIDLYLDRHLEIHKRPQSFKFFQEQSQSLKHKLEETERELQTFKRLNNVTALEEQRSLLLRQEAELHSALDDASSQEAETANRLDQLRRQLAATPETTPQGEDIDHNMSLISTLQARLVELELKEKELLSKYTEQSRLVMSVRDEISMVREKLQEQESKRYGRNSFGPNQTYQRLQEELLKNERDLNALKAKKKTLAVQLESYQRKLEELNRIEVEFNMLQDKIEIDQQNYRLYLSKFEESRISDAMDAEKITNVTQIQQALVPLKPVSPKRVLNILLAILLGIFGGLGLAFSSECFDDRTDSPEVAENVLGLPVLGSIPLLKS